jgi:hypothetical protein
MKKSPEHFAICLRSRAGDQKARQRLLCRGFMSADMLFGIIIVMSVTITLLVTIRHVHVVEQGLSDSRGALHLAEHALLNLQHSQRLPAVTTGQTLTIHRVSSGSAAAGFAWAKVDAVVRGHAQSLLGVVPVSAIPSDGGKP